MIAAKAAIKAHVQVKLNPPKYFPYSPMEKPMATISAAATVMCLTSLGLDVIVVLAWWTHFVAVLVRVV